MCNMQVDWLPPEKIPKEVSFFVSGGLYINRWLYARDRSALIR